MKTNYQMIRDLEDFTPEHMGFVTKTECEHIKETLHISEMGELELRNLRDFAVMYYANKKCSEMREELAVMDKMSAICEIIDTELFKRGCEV